MFHARFTWLGIILPSPHCFHRCNQFSKRSTQICHCFPILFPLFYVMFPHLFIVYPKFQTYGMKIALLTKFGQKLNFCTSHVCHFLISKLQFFHCFSITRYWSHIGASILLGIILPSPYSFHRFSSRINFPSVLLKFSIAFPFFHCFIS